MTAVGSELRELLFAAEEEVTRAWAAAENANADSLSVDTAANTVLDRIAQIGILLLENRQYEEIDRVVETLVHLFRTAGEQRPLTLMATPIANERQALRWFQITMRVYLLGAVSVSLKVFNVLRHLVLQQPNESRRGRFWLRETVTGLARLSLFRKNSTENVSKPLLGPISEFISERPVFYRRFHSNKDDTVSYLCRFDFLQCVISVSETNDLSACYPNFGGFYKERTEPIVVDLITGGKSREALGTLDDSILATIIADLDTLAGREFFSYVGWDAGHWDDERIPAFMAKHLAKPRQ